MNCFKIVLQLYDKNFNVRLRFSVNIVIFFLLYFEIEILVVEIYIKYVNMKRILGLDLGTNSIGWALILQNFKDKKGEILGMGSRIIPMSQDRKDDFGKGNSISQTADRTRFRGTRKLRERFLLRRERLHRILNVLGFLPEHYANQIDFEKRLGKFLEEKEPKITYKEIWNQEKEKNEFDFIFKNTFEEMVDEFREHQPQLLESGKKFLSIGQFIICVKKL